MHRVVPSNLTALSNKQSVMGRISDIKSKIGAVVISGIKSVSRCVITKVKDTEDQHGKENQPRCNNISRTSFRRSRIVRCTPSTWH